MSLTFLHPPEDNIKNKTTASHNTNKVKLIPGSSSAEERR